MEEHHEQQKKAKIQELTEFGAHATARISGSVVSIDQEKERVRFRVGDTILDLWIFEVEAHPIIGG